MSRPDLDTWRLDGARWMAQRGDCTRRQVGAVIFGPDKRLWGSGYNGARPGGKSCLAGDCPRGRHYKLDADDHWNDGCEDGCHNEDCRGCGRNKYCGPGSCPDSKCVECGKKWPCATSVGVCGCGKWWPCPDAVEPGSSYDTGAGACIATHAEANAVADAMQRCGGRLADAVMYVSDEPCEGCIRHVRNTTDIGAIIWPNGAIGLP